MSRELEREGRRERTRFKGLGKFTVPVCNGWNPSARVGVEAGEHATKVHVGQYRIEHKRWLEKIKALLVNSSLQLKQKEEYTPFSL